MTDQIPTPAQRPPRPSGTIWDQFATVYGSLDAQDCAYVDREWAKWRGLTLAAQPPAAPVEFDSLSGARKQAMESHASMLPRSSAGSALRPDVREALEQALERLHGVEDYRLGKKAALPSVQGAIELICSALSSPHPADEPQAGLDPVTIEKCAKVAERWEGIDNVAAQIRSLAVTRPHQRGGE